MSEPYPREAGPVYAACLELDPDALRSALANLAAGVDLNVRMRGIASPLRIVINKSDDAEMVSMLLKAGLDVNDIGSTGQTPLHVAVRHGRVDCVAVLLAAGASVTIKYDGLTPIDEVTNENCRRIVPMLRRAGSEGVYLEQQRPGTSNTRWWFHDYAGQPFHAENYRILTSYFMKIIMSNRGRPGPGTFATYEKAHRARLTKTFVLKFPRLPPDVIPTIVAYAFHTGYY